MKIDCEAERKVKESEFQTVECGCLYLSIMSFPNMSSVKESVKVWVSELLILFSTLSH